MKPYKCEACVSDLVEYISYVAMETNSEWRHQISFMRSLRITVRWLKSKTKPIIRILIMVWQIVYDTYDEIIYDWQKNLET